jgi:hypothetical protein
VSWNHLRVRIDYRVASKSTCAFQELTIHLNSPVHFNPQETGPIAQEEPSHSPRLQQDWRGGFRWVGGEKVFWGMLYPQTHRYDNAKDSDSQPRQGVCVRTQLYEAEGETRSLT